MTIKLNLQEKLPWHINAWNFLAEYINSQRIPQALLITGGEGLGKLFLAQQFGLALVCQQRLATGLACSHCSACQLAAADTHPDLITVFPLESGKVISINQIRDLLKQLQLKPQFEQHRVVIINPSEQMNQAAANALLKCLEEPPERTVIILIAESQTSLAATILSRCQQLAITAPDLELSRQWLKHQNVTDNVEILINIASGAPLLAYRYADQNILAQRQTCFEQWFGLIKYKQSAVQIAELWCKLESDLVQPDLVLTWLVSWVMDIIKLHSTINASLLTNNDLVKPLQECAQRLELNQLFQFYDLLLISQQRLQTQLNKQLIYEQLLLTWSTYNTE